MESIWFEDCKIGKREKLNGDIKTDVAIVGAGLAGILTAFLLKERGISSVIIDAKEIASGVTCKTTAKITSLHDLFYYKLIDFFGQELAKQYADANEYAIKKYYEIINKRGIDCDFEFCSAYVYSQGDIKNIENEVNSAVKLGLPASFTTNTELPFKVTGAVEFKNQAAFHPLKFIKGLADELEIYENTAAIEIDKNYVKTNNGVIYAKSIAITSHYPAININNLYFAKIYQKTSYLLALKNAGLVQGMYIGENGTGYSFRSYNDYLLFGGEGHRTGGKDKDSSSYQKLEIKAKEYYNNCEVVCKWSAQDCVTLDDIPYIGHYSKTTPNIYVATGFKKWGMTHSMVSANIISDMIEGKNNSNSEIFSPKRFNFSASKKHIKENIKKTLKSFTIDKIKVVNFNIDEIEIGQAKTILYNDEKVGVYKDKSGEIFMLSTKCPHMGCELAWNNDEHSWDCPCHGSRFDYKGNLIDNPASRGIKREDV